MKKINTLLLVLFVAGLVVSSNASAAGFGVYGTVGAGSADWAADYNTRNEIAFTKHTNHMGAGLVFDTAPASDKLFNYQLNIGYDRFSNKNGAAWGIIDFDGLMISNNFGFGMLLNPKTRLWFGPELRVEWATGLASTYRAYKIRLFGVGIGPVLGVNFNMGDSHTFAIKAGYQYLYFTGKGEGGYSHTEGATGYSKYDYDVTEKMVYVNLEYLFRTSGDRQH